jgi:flagellar motility protein MotE (MotC chaperone)
VEGRIGTATANRDSVESQRFKSIVTMYENMKPKDAARIFDVLDMRILIEVATEMNPRKMSEVLAQMTSDGAQRLTVELANRAALAKAQATEPLPPDKLPKIEGRPNGN